MGKGRSNPVPEVDVEDDFDKESVPWWTSCRLALAVLGFFGFVNVYALRVNMSVAIVCMVNQTALRLKDANTSGNGSQTSSYSSQCGMVGAVDANGTSSKDMQDGEFEWNKSIQGVILGSFFWGYLLTQIPGGWLATKVGGKRVLGYSMLGATIATFLTPFAAQTHYIMLIVLRVIVGITSGVCYPSMHALWGSWAPPLERSKLAAFTYAGAQVGNVITFPLAGLLCKYGFAGGWPSIFYVLGILSFVWFVLWMFFVSDTPSQHKRITKAERNYIKHALKDSVNSDGDKKLDVPWKGMALSMPVIAILVANITTDWGTYTLLTSIPTYMNEVLKLDISANGLFSALPYIVFWAMINVSGWIADFIMSKGCCSITITRKAFTITGMLLPAALLICLGYVDCTQPGFAIALLVLGVATTGFQYSGWIVNHMDIAPAFAGILFGITNSIAAVTGFLSPYVVGVITEDQSREQWQIVFYIAGGFYIFGSVFYGIFASGEMQPWARDDVIAVAAEELLQGTELQVKVTDDKRNGVEEKHL
ncbi:sialin-like isoform X2 [Ruditapes philippinarum]|uniref:sialin-like isoform X2 n=1 Tax=Ruditapes philippinarum TaxID=129788 RepID=UPI00295B5093|nr:sialin-like isoform X2 [Ruditapes philippinarum]